MLVGLGALSLVLGSLGLFTQSAEAYRGDPSQKGPNFSEERHAQMIKAFETNDYDSWKNLMENKGRVTQIINKDNFVKFAEAYKLAKNGDMEGAKKIRQDLGLGLKNGLGKNMKDALGGGFARGLRGNR